MTTNDALKMLKTLDPASDEFKSAVAELLGNIDPTKPYGTTLYDAIAKVSISEAFEAVLLRERDGKIEVYMTTRSMTDTAYPGECHCPGSVFRPREKEADVTARLERREYGCKITGWQYIGNVRTAEARGSFNSLIYLIEVDGEPKNDNGAWYNVDELPSNTVDIHAERIIPFAVAAFRWRAVCCSAPSKSA